MADDILNENENEVVADVEEPTIVLKINNVEFPNVIKGAMSIEPITRYNEYVGEDGSSTVEEINSGFYQGSVTYKGLTQAEVHRLYSALRTVSTVSILDPTGETEAYYNMQCIIDNKKLPYKYKDKDLSVWGLQFSFRQFANVPLPTPTEGGEVNA